ncbi:TonB-dependent receptor [Marinicella meishanensis]|uniref:TonB-dependent receptor n=1 Tax=Marinicella meishanensis TaxID=2873263 RepID=UPI001CBE6579|nr:TonB-dependent receptor [Marinicella sp. NBU2979]
MYNKPTGSVTHWLLILLCLLFFATGQVLAQSQEDTAAATSEAEAEADTDDDNADESEADDTVELAPVVTTGSRLLKSTYESISPMQVITAQESREVGQIDAAEIIQNASASNGQQIDLTFSGFVLDNGPGARTISFRGLGANRTLLMINGRRLGGSGVEGAPASPDLNMIPDGLVQQYDLLLDGSSSIYGSDAVAGVLNTVLRKDFNGWEVDFNTTVPEQSGGVEQRLNVAWGKNFARGFIGFGAELYDLEAVRYNERDWTNKCPEHYERTQSGELRQNDLFNEVFNKRFNGNCYFQGLVGRISVPSVGSIYYTPGTSNGGWPNFSESSLQGPVDTNGDGIADVASFVPYSLYDYQTDATLFLEMKTQDIMSYGEYTFEGDMNITPFFEASFSRRDTFQDSGQPQFFPFVPADNPFNLCNPNGLNGVDCGLAFDQLLSNPSVIQNYMDRFGCDPSAGGDCDQTVGAIGPQRSRPIIAIDGDRDQTSATVEQTRLVFGVRGDLPQLEIGSFSNWAFETYISHHESDGTSSRRGIRQDRLDYSLNTSRIDPVTGQVICGNNDGCVPINLFAPSLYSPIVSDFSTQAERDYLFDSRDFRTKVEQTIWSAFASGYVANLPAGPITAGLGFEIRRDEIQSIPDDIARDGLFFGFFADGGATGSKFTREAFTEVQIPLVANKPGIEELNLNISGRYTKDEFFPSANTYSAKLGYRPVTSLLLRLTKGTSYRAPNLRENFLLAQTGFGNVFDPCFIPEDAYDPINNVYVPEQDTRSPEVLSNCAANGADPTTLYNNGFNTFSTEIATGGVTDINEEKSDSLTYGFAWDVPFSDHFDLTIGATYYKIETNNTIIEPSAQFIVNDCYNDAEGDSSFCSRITRDENGVFDIIDSGFINRDNQTVKGVDVNINYDQRFTVFNRDVKFGADLVMTHIKESSDLFTDDEGNRNFDEDQGQFGYADWSGSLNLRADVGNFRFAWQTRYIGSVGVDEDVDNEFDDYFGNMYTCAGPDEGDELCRFVYDAGPYFNHTASVNWLKDAWTVRFGVVNVFNEEPPQVDAGIPLTTAVNSPQGYGYDLNGRRYFLNVGYKF